MILGNFFHPLSEKGIFLQMSIHLQHFVMLNASFNLNYRENCKFSATGYCSRSDRSACRVLDRGGFYCTPDQSVFMSFS